MHPIKTYDHVNAKDHSLNFSISRMEDIYDKRSGMQDDPHRHDFYTVVIVKEAKGEHVIDFNAYSLNANQAYFITPGQVHQIKEEQKSFGFAITFSSDFLSHNYIPQEFINNLNLFEDFGNTPPLTLNDDDLQTISRYAEELISVYQSDIKLKYEALGPWLKLILIQCNNICDRSTQRHINQDPAHSLLHRYKLLIDQKHTAWHGVAEYAQELNVTADHLNRVVKSLTGKTAKEHIQSSLIVAAKRLIYFSSMTTKELAFALGFSEPANFSAFFKKCTSLSPSEFKTQAAN